MIGTANSLIYKLLLRKKLQMKLTINYIKLPHLDSLLTYFNLFLFSVAFSSAVFFLFPPVWNAVNNADSLVLFEIANDWWLGKSLYGWNFPRVPYVFPDLLIAFVLMSPQWLNEITLVTVAAINFSLLSLVSHRLIQSVCYAKPPSVLATAVLLALSLGIVAAGFPFAMSHIYWQIFSSGAHYLSVIVVAYIYILTPANRLSSLSTARCFWILLLVFLVTLSNLMAGFLLGALFFSRWAGGVLAALTSSVRLHLLRPFEVMVLLSIVAGAWAGGQIPKQSISDSFFARNLYLISLDNYSQWLTSSWLNVLFLIVLICLSLCWTLMSSSNLRASLMESPKHYANWLMFICNPFLLPVIGIFIATPFLFGEIANLRYYAFPSLLALLALSSILWKVHQWIQNKKGLWISHALSCGLGFLLISICLTNTDTTFAAAELPMHKIGLSQGIKANQAVACVNTAMQQHKLLDGLSSYWLARPVRFASQFKYYLAETNPHGEYFLWGNNGMDLLYSNPERTQYRQYNYLLATNTELSKNHWGTVLGKASHRIDCDQHTLFVYADTSTLTQFLFPWGMPQSISGKGEVKEKPYSSGGQDAALGYDAAVVTFLAEDLKTITGKRARSLLLAENKEGYLVHGPYIRLPPGRYTLTAYGDLASDGKQVAVLDVVSNTGTSVITKTQILLPAPRQIKQVPQPQPTAFAQLEFTLDKPENQVEFRLYVPSTAAGFFERYVLMRQQPR